MRKTKETGITLIALIITVIVMLILAGVAINLTVGDNGIFKKTADSADITKREHAREKLSLVLTDVQMRRIKEGESLALSSGMASEIEAYKDITSATFTGSKINTIVDGYNFEINGDLGIESKKEIAKVEPENLSDWEYQVEADGTATLLGYKGNATKVVVPNYIEGYWVKRIGRGNNWLGNGIWKNGLQPLQCSSGVSMGQMTIKEIIVSEGIEIIDDCAFYNAMVLEKIVLPRTVVRIGERAIGIYNFTDISQYEKSLDEINLYKNIKYCGSSILAGRSGIIINVEKEQKDIPETWDAQWSEIKISVSSIEIEAPTINYNVKMD